MIIKLKEMLLDFLLITAGISLSATVFCTIFYQDVRFGIELLWQVAALSFFCTLPGFVFYSKKELMKKQMLTRQIIHLCILIVLLLFFTYHWNWIDWRNIVQPVIFIAMFALVYVVVCYFTYKRDEKVASMLNERLAEYKHKNTG